MSKTNNFKIKKQGHGYFRKNKAVKGLATAIAIGGVIVSSTAKADEVVDITTTGTDAVTDAGGSTLLAVTEQVLSDSPATNLIEAQQEGGYTTEHVQSLANEGQVVGEGITSSVESSSLHQSVDEAVAVGVHVIENSTADTKDNLNEAQAALDNQEKKVDSAKETQTEVNAIAAENERKAEKENLKIEKGNTKSYRDENDKALMDARQQSADVSSAVTAKDDANLRIKTAVDTVRSLGVVVSEPGSTTRPLSAEESIVKGLTDASKAREEAVEILNKAIIEASATEPSTVVKFEGTVSATAEDAVEKANDQVALIASVVEENKKRKADSIKAHEDEVSAVNKRNEEGQKAMDAKNAEGQAAVDKRNAEGQAAVDKRNAEQQNKISAIQASNNAKQAAVDKANAEGQALVEARNEAKRKEVEEANAKAKAEADAQTADASAKQAEYDRIQASNKSIMESKGLSFTGNYSVDKATVDKWNAENAGTFTETSGSKTTGITTTSSTTVEVLDGVKETYGQAQRHTYIFTEGDRQNMTIASATEKGGSVSFNVKDTSNGDVKMTFFDITPSSSSGWTKDNVFGTVGIDVKGDGGIGFTVGVIAGGGVSNVGGGVEGGSIGSTGGWISSGAGTWLKSFKIMIETSEGVQILTFNDLDNGQSLVIDNAGNSQKTGSAISGSGNSYSAGSGNVVQATTGQLGSHSVEFDYGEGATVSTSATLTNAGEQLFHIIAGIFGPSSIHELKSEVTIDPISIQDPGTVPNVGNYTPIEFTPETFTPETFTPEEVPSYVPETFTPETFTPETFIPEKSPIYKEPEYKSVTVKNIEVVAGYDLVQATVQLHDIQIETTVNPVEIVQKPTNIKAVYNTEGTDINGQTVAKGSTVDWSTGGETLKAGRPQFSTISREDFLAPGQTVDLARTQASSDKITFTYNAETHSVLQSVKASVLAEANLDQTKAFILPEGRIYTTVENDGATYENNFTTTFVAADSVIIDKDGQIRTEGKTNTYRITSNNVVVYTPGSDYRTYNGNVVVRYFDIQTNETIAPNAVDTEDGKVGSKYDTTDHKPAIIAHDGKLYELTTKVGGNEQGEVVRGTTFVDYYYDLRPEKAGVGSVVVHYINEDGETISNDVVDTLDAPVGDKYTTTDNKPQTIVTPDGIEYQITPVVHGEEDGDIIEGVIEVTYVYKRITPKPETPTPNDSRIEPEKHIHQVGDNIVNGDGQRLDGLTLLPNRTYEYTAFTDNNQYKGLTATKEDINRRFIPLVDDPQDSTVTFDFSTLKTKLADGTDVSSDFEVRSYTSLDEAEEVIANILKVAGITPEGEFTVVVPKDLDFEAYYNKYVKTGINLYHTFEISTGDFVGTFNNKVWQVDFGNGYAGNIVENNVPKLEAIKQILKSIGSNEDITGGIVEINQVYPAKLRFPETPVDIDGGLKNLWGIEDFDEYYDEYNGEFYAFAYGDMKLKDGTIIKGGDELSEELTRYITQTLIRNEDGKVVAVKYEINSDFIELLAKGERVKIDVYSMLKRINYGENIENKWTVYVNDIEVAEVIVVTHTPRPIPPAPEKPTNPAEPTIVAPDVANTPLEQETVPTDTPVNVLPNTGEASSVMAAFAGLGILALAGIGFKKREEV